MQVDWNPKTRSVIGQGGESNTPCRLGGISAALVPLCLHPGRSTGVKEVKLRLTGAPPRWTRWLLQGLCQYPWWVISSAAALHCTEILWVCRSSAGTEQKILTSPTGGADLFVRSVCTVIKHWGNKADRGETAEVSKDESETRAWKELDGREGEKGVENVRQRNDGKMRSRPHVKRTPSVKTTVWQRGLTLPLKLTNTSFFFKVKHYNSTNFIPRLNSWVGTNTLWYSGTNWQLI